MISEMCQLDNMLRFPMKNRYVVASVHVCVQCRFFIICKKDYLLKEFTFRSGITGFSAQNHRPSDVGDIFERG